MIKCHIWMIINLSLDKLEARIGRVHLLIMLEGKGGEGKGKLFLWHER